MKCVSFLLRMSHKVIITLTSHYLILVMGLFWFYERLKSYGAQRKGEEHKRNVQVA